MVESSKFLQWKWARINWDTIRDIILDEAVVNVGFCGSKRELFVRPDTRVWLNRAKRYANIVYGLVQVRSERDFRAFNR
jgi:hypothetical protein